MEQTLTEIWESSRSNQYSWILPVILIGGFAWFLILTKVKFIAVRRVTKIISFLILIYVAMIASSMQISEKWRIRHEWGHANESTITDRERRALTADGANLVMGPMIYGGGGGFLVFSIALIISSFVIRKKKRNPNK